MLGFTLGSWSLGHGYGLGLTSEIGTCKIRYTMRMRGPTVGKVKWPSGQGCVLRVPKTPHHRSFSPD